LQHRHKGRGKKGDGKGQAGVGHAGGLEQFAQPWNRAFAGPPMRVTFSHAG